MRKKLFSSAPRKKLFSEERNGDDGMTLRTLICPDCGTCIETAEHPSQAYCPNCGSKRMRIKFIPYSEPTVPEPVKTEEREFSIFLSPYEKKLKEYSGKELSKNEFEKIFSDKTDYMLERGFASVQGDNIKISETAFAGERLFSKLIIQVTKVMDLDEGVVSGRIPKADIIEQLDAHSIIPEKGIFLLKKAHGLIPRETQFSETWLEDSSIIPDLYYEYGNKSFGIKQFIDILRNRYPDAPENIIDLLVDKGVIFLDGSQVTVKQG
jgi:ribosomal protein S27AE